MLHFRPPAWHPRGGQGTLADEVCRGVARATNGARSALDRSRGRRIAAEDIPSLLQFNAAAEVRLRTVVHTRF